METKKIKIKVQERTTSDGKKKFNTYKTVTKNGRLMEVKFRKDVTTLPTEDCYAVIGVDNMNVDKSKEYPTIWVAAVESYESIEANSKANNKKKLDDLFD